MRNKTDILIPDDIFNGDDPDLHLAWYAVEAFWQAYEKNRYGWEIPGIRPLINSCILSALTVRDILHGVGRRDAEAFRSGLDLICPRVDGGWLAIGEPDTPVVDTLWPAHMTVKLGDYLIDPVIGQTKRPWNDMARSAILKANRDPGVPLTLQNGEKARVYTWNYWDIDGREYRLAYFKLTHEIHQRTRDWKNAPDANPVRRERLVRDGIAILQQANIKAAA